MYEELRKHREMVQDRILKSFGNDSEDSVEKSEDSEKLEEKNNNKKE